MATDAQIQANRRNAAKSSGPKTQEGKEKTRCNALKHGGRARTVNVMPVLPHEDPRQLAERVQDWLDGWQPRDVTERDLVLRGAKLAWQLERGERFEAAHLAKRVRREQQQAGPDAGFRRMTGRVHDLGRKLFYDYRPGTLDIPGPAWPDVPAVFVARLEETLEGRRWLLDRWAELRHLLDCGGAWLAWDVYRLVRLLGMRGAEAVNDPVLNAVFLAIDVLRPGDARTFWKEQVTRMPDRDLAFKGWAQWRSWVPARRQGRGDRGPPRGDRRADRTAGPDRLRVSRDRRGRERSAPTARCSTRAWRSSGPGGTRPRWAGSCCGRWRRCGGCGKTGPRPPGRRRARLRPRRAPAGPTGSQASRATRGSLFVGLPTPPCGRPEVSRRRGVRDQDTLRSKDGRLRILWLNRPLLHGRVRRPCRSAIPHGRVRRPRRTCYHPRRG